MLLFSELDKGTPIRLNVRSGEHAMEFDSVVRHKPGRQVLIDAVQRDGQTLNVKGCQVDILLAREDEKPIRWKDCELTCVSYKKEVYYALEGYNIGREFNRRSGYRLSIGEEVTVKIGHGGFDYAAILKDISNSGFAFILDKEVKGAEESFVYTDYTGLLGEREVNMPLHGKVVRTMPLPDGRMLYGCVLTQKNVLIGHYINQKQMEQLAKKNPRYGKK